MTEKNTEARCVRPTRLVAAAALVLAIATTVRAEAPADNIVRIYPSAVVTCDQVTLGDIASLTGAGTELAATWAITESPKPGQEIALDQASIQKALIRRGINPSQWLVRGSARCRISRPMPLRTATQPESAIPEAKAEKSTGRRAVRTALRATSTAPAIEQAETRQPAVPNPDTLEGAIYQHIAARLSRYEGRPSIQMSPAIRNLMQLSRPAYEFSITDRSDRSIGMVPLEIAIVRDGKLDQVQSILVHVSLVKRVVVAAGPINRGQTVGPENIVLREREFEKTDELGLDNLKAIVGQRAVRFVSRDEMLTSRDIEPLPLILRNDIVTVTARVGSITITSAAKALEPGVYGATISLRNEASKQTFPGIVTGPKTADLRVGAGGEPKALTMAGGKN